MQILTNHRFLIGAGSMVLFGAAVYEYSIKQAKNTGFHVRDKDPNLRKVEKDVVIPKMMRDRARLVDCVEQVKTFNTCVNKYKKGYEKYMTFVYCKPESDSMLKCMNDLFLDYDYYLLCKDIFLKEKKLFDLTKMDKKDRNIIKEYLVSGQIPELELNEDAAKYYENVKSVYARTSDIEKYDNDLLES